MRKSKYIGLKIGDWICTHVGVDRVQPAYKLKRDALGKRVRNKYPGHMSYYYIFERLTSDEKAMKMVRLSASQAKQVLEKVRTVEYFAQKKQSERSRKFTEKVSYSFN
jgi:hypothetical protein